MAPGDLNLKKSWNPALMKNQQKVWEAESSVLEERKRIQERQLEIRKEKELNELLHLQGRDPTKRLDWMYIQPKKESSERSNQEEYLLGKKRLDASVLRLEIASKRQGFDALNLQTSHESQNESVSHHRQDPMIKIREQQMKRSQERKERYQGNEKKHLERKKLDARRKRNSNSSSYDSMGPGTDQRLQTDNMRVDRHYKKQRLEPEDDKPKYRDRSDRNLKTGYTDNFHKDKPRS